MMDVPEPNTIHQRLSTLIDYFCKGNKTAFGRETDILPGVLASITGGRLSKPSFELLQKIMTRYPTVSGDWLILGRGPMLQGDSQTPEAAEAAQQYVTRVQFDETLQRVAEMEAFMTAYLNAKAEHLQRTYHLGKEATPGLDYDDRLTTRLIPFNEREILTLLKKPEEKGGIRHVKEGDKYRVTESALREWAGDAPKSK